MSRRRESISPFYDGMEDMELVGHVEGIPDASDLSRALASRLRAAVIRCRQQEARIIDLADDLDVARDKVEGFMELTAGMVGARAET